MKSLDINLEQYIAKGIIQLSKKGEKIKSLKLGHLLESMAELLLESGSNSVFISKLFLKYI